MQAHLLSRVLSWWNKLGFRWFLQQRWNCTARTQCQQTCLVDLDCQVTGSPRTSRNGTRHARSPPPRPPKAHFLFSLRVRLWYLQHLSRPVPVSGTRESSLPAHSESTRGPSSRQVSRFLEGPNPSSFLCLSLCPRSVLSAVRLNPLIWVCWQLSCCWPLSFLTKWPLGVCTLALNIGYCCHLEDLIMLVVIITTVPHSGAIHDLVAMLVGYPGNTLK